MPSNGTANRTSSTSLNAELIRCLLPADAGLLGAVAERAAAYLLAELQAGTAATVAHDFSQAVVLVPNLHVAVPLRREVGRLLTAAAGGPVMMPLFTTLGSWLADEPLSDAQPTLQPLPDAERLLALYQALAERQWFDEAALWGIASELAALFDELTAAAVALPADVATFAARLESAYRLRGSQPLNFEARLVHELWHALAALGRPDSPGAQRLRLARRATAAAQPLVVLLDSEPQGEIAAFIDAYAARRAVLLCYPHSFTLATTPLERCLSSAWPAGNDEHDAAPLAERASRLRESQPDSPLAGRLRLLPAHSREQEAAAAVAQVAAWLAEGRSDIALIAQDRLTARRVRALLERRQVLVADESGWKLSTSRAAASVDALLEVRAGKAYHRDLLDLLKSPFFFADVDESQRKNAVFAFEAVIRAASAKSGLSRMRSLAVQAGADASALVERVALALDQLRGRATSLVDWLDRLEAALDLLGARQPLAADAAGAALLDLLSRRRGELREAAGSFRFAAWRDWLNREFESETFRDTSIVSSIAMTHLAAARLRPFAAALLIGGDAAQLKPQEPPSRFFNQSVRRELGLPMRDIARRRLRDDLAMLLATVPQVAITWQAECNGEANLLAPELDQLATLHRLAWASDLRQPLPRLAELAPADADLPPVELTVAAAPTVPPGRLPQRMTVSTYASLIACPYRFFARAVLGLGEVDEVREELDKRGYGELVHSSLERFHGQYPSLTSVSDEEALAALQGIVGEVFASAVADDYLALGWQVRWTAKLPAYIDWQRQRESEGWRWQAAETKLVRRLGGDDEENEDGGPYCPPIELRGRADRMDENAAGETALLDYKARSKKSLVDGLAEDVQLAAYAIMAVADVSQAAYVALDDAAISTVAIPDPGLAAQHEEQRLRRSFAAMHAGQPLPAHGADKVCGFCEVIGLCRKPYV